MARLSGLGGKVVVGSTDLGGIVKSWSFEPSAKVDAQFFTDSNYESNLVVGLSGSGTVEIAYDATTNVFDTVDIGDELALKLYIGASGDYHDIPKAVVNSEPTALEAGGVINVTINFVTNGTYTLNVTPTP